MVSVVLPVGYSSARWNIPSFLFQFEFLFSAQALAYLYNLPLLLAIPGAILSSTDLFITLPVLLLLQLIALGRASNFFCGTRVGCVALADTKHLTFASTLMSDATTA